MNATLLIENVVVVATAKADNRKLKLWKVENIELLLRLKRKRPRAFIEGSVELSECDKPIRVYVRLYDFVQFKIRPRPAKGRCGRKELRHKLLFSVGSDVDASNTVHEVVSTHVVISRNNDHASLIAISKPFG